VLKWFAEVNEIDEAIDDAMEHIFQRDGRLSYKEASDDFSIGLR
jgi:hypothetical protein